MTTTTVTPACFTAVREGRAHPDDWFPEFHGTSRLNKRAQEICRGCPLQEPCHSTRPTGDRVACAEQHGPSGHGQ